MAGQRLGCFTGETQTSILSGLSFRATFCGEGLLLLPDIYTPVGHTLMRCTHLWDEHTREAYTPEMHTPVRCTHLSANNLGEVWKWGLHSQTFTQVLLSVLAWSMPCGPGARAHVHYEQWLRLLPSLMPPIRDLSWDWAARNSFPLIGLPVTSTWDVAPSALSQVTASSVHSCL